MSRFMRIMVFFDLPVKTKAQRYELSCTLAIFKDDTMMVAVFLHSAAFAMDRIRWKHIEASFACLARRVRARW